MCTLHGGDIGVSSKEGEGSTFGFFFKVRRSDGNSEDGRPPFQSRSNSEASNPPARAETPGSRQRPGFSRANSNLRIVKERQNERPEAKSLASHSGVDTDEMEPSLLNPPTESVPESHPASTKDSRYKETEDVAKEITNKKPYMEKNLPDLRRGETTRQEGHAQSVSRSHSDQRSEKKQTLLLVEDNLINQKVLRRQLQSRGFEVFTANNGQEAIDAVIERGKVSSDDTNDRNYFDCILMDQEMPIKDGNVATQEIRQLQKEGKAGFSHILGVSANVREAQTNGMRDAGMDDTISKPFKVDDLVKKVRGLVLDSGNERNDNRPVDDHDHDSEAKKMKDRKETRNTHQEGDMDHLHPGRGADGQWRSSERNGREGEGRGGERSRSRETRN